MVAPVAAYVVAIGTMLFAGLAALTLITVVKHLDPPEPAAAAPPVWVPDENRGLIRDTVAQCGRAQGSALHGRPPARLV